MNLFVAAIQTLREEDNYAQRYGAITMGGLVGYILALRHGKLRRLFNTVVGAAAVGAVCYPDEAKEYSADGYRRAKRHIAIAYHLVNGGEVLLNILFCIETSFYFS